MAIYFVTYEPKSQEQETKDIQIILKSFYPGHAWHIGFGKWCVIGGPNAGCVRNKVHKILGYHPRLCLVSSIESDSILELTNRDSEEYQALKALLPSDVLL